MRSEKTAALLKEGVSAVNFGMERFYDDLRAQDVAAVHVEWKPPAAKPELLARLRRLREG